MIPKFRVWDIEQSTMFTEDDLLTIKFCQDEICAEIDDYLVDDIYEIEPFELMQSTGMKDKNGIEIYEGDVVKVNKWISNKRLIGVVEYCGAAFRVRGVKQYLGSEDELNGLYVVIGNKYEHPYLLEEDNHASN